MDDRDWLILHTLFNEKALQKLDKAYLLPNQRLQNALSKLKQNLGLKLLIGE